MSGDPEQEYFADGMTEDLITDLSKVSGLSVIARNSVFTYKGKPADIQEVSRRFGVATVLEGSVRKAGQRVRINAQLIDGKDGTHLWADRYDRDLTDIFALQDEITKTIVEQLKVRLLPGESRPSRRPDAQCRRLQLLLAGAAFLPPPFDAARAARPTAVPQGGRARSALCARLCGAGGLRLVPVHQPSAGRHGRRDTFRQHDGAAIWIRRSPKPMPRTGMALHLVGPQQEAVAEFDKAIELDPNLFEAFYLYAYACRDGGDKEGAARMYARAAELAPTISAPCMMRRRC